MARYNEIVESMIDRHIIVDNNDNITLSARTMDYFIDLLQRESRKIRLEDFFHILIDVYEMKNSYDIRDYGVVLYQLLATREDLNNLSGFLLDRSYDDREYR